MRRRELIESLADVDEFIGDKYLMEENISDDEIYTAIRRATIARTFTPVRKRLTQCHFASVGHPFAMPALLTIEGALPSFLPSRWELLLGNGLELGIPWLCTEEQRSAAFIGRRLCVPTESDRG